MTAGRRLSYTLTDSLGKYSREAVLKLELPETPAGVSREFPLKLNFDLQEFPQLQSEKRL